MTLIIDHRQELGDKPGIHALFVGVSNYTFLPGGTGETSESFGMRQLSSAAFTAYQIYRWFIDHQNGLPAPLATCRVLLSPSQQELAKEPELTSVASPAPIEKFLVTANEWRRDASSNPDNITVFYFAGHGLELTKSEVIMLFEDFGNNIGPILRGGVSVSNIFYGMAPLKRFENIARSQIYFIDTDRTIPEQLKHYELANTTSVFDAERLDLDDRRATIFHAATSGGPAYSVKGGQSLFSKALLKCLGGEAAVPVEQDAEGNLGWHVSIHSLADKLGPALSELTEKYGIKQFYEVAGIVRDWSIYYLDEAPQVDVSIEIEPAEAAPFTRVTIVNESGESIELPEPPVPNPYQLHLPAGFYRIGATITDSGSGYVDRSPRIHLVMPPRVVWKVTVNP